MKRLSVITPAYYAKPFIHRSIASVQQQKLPKGVCIEHIIVADDLQDYNDLRVQARNYIMRLGSTERCGAGPSVARNLGMDMATGDYVSFLDADDLWYPDRVVRLLPDVDKVGAATCRVEVIHGGKTHGRPLIPFNGDIPPDVTLRIDGAYFPIYKMEHAEHRWDESICFAEDMIFNLRALISAGLLRVRNDMLMAYVVRQGSLSHTMPQACIRADEAYEHFINMLEQWAWMPNDLRAAFRERMTEKRMVNRKYLRAWEKDRNLTFEQFVTRVDDGCLQEQTL
ncbi:MAG: glycosyltransferase family 2 protein [Halothiobacillus sp.]|nr:glycosyltransferase family 2 protein [Halothiobacillus sp.]